MPIQDNTPPIITIPDDITKDATSEGGASVNFDVSAYDVQDGTIPYSCSHLSGSIFAIGSTTVTCTASDNAGNSASERFIVMINAYVEPTLSCEGASGQSGDNCPDAVIRGGLEILYLPNPIPGIDLDSISGTYTATTLAVEKNDGTTGLIISGHAVVDLNAYETDSMPVTTAITQTKDGMTISEEVAQGDYIARGASLQYDAAFIPVSSNHLDLYAVNGTINGVESIHQVQNGNSAEVQRVSQPIHLFGIYIDDQGLLLFHNATVTATLDNRFTYTLINQAIGHYDSERGDSGSPVITFVDNQAKIIGVHQGVGCMFTPDGYGAIDVTKLTQSIGNATVAVVCGDGDFDSLGNYYKVFSPWETIVREFALK